MILPVKNFDGLNSTFNTNMDCNLACKYCYEVDKKKIVLDINTAKKFIDILLTEDPMKLKGTKDEDVAGPGLILDFIGGDALMHPELLNSILEYFVFTATLKKHRYATNWRASISTNGTLFGNPEVQKFINKYNTCLSIGISFDGTPELHDLNRIFPDGTGSFSAIMKNWEWFKSVRGSQALTTKATLAKPSIPFIYDSLVFMHETLGLTQINQNFIFEDMELTENDLKELDNQLAKSVEYVLQHSDDLYWGMLDENKFAMARPIDKAIEDHYESRSCGSGIMPTLAPDGKIYPCFRFLPHTVKEGIIPYSAGDVVNGIDTDKFKQVREQTRDKISEQRCLECPIESGCSWCIGGCYAESGKFYRQTYICEVMKLQVKHSRNYWNRYYKEERY